MSLKHMTTKEFLKMIDVIGLKADIRAESIDIHLDGRRCATVYRHKMLSFEMNTETLDNRTAAFLADTVLCYVKTPVDKRTPRACKLKIHDTGLYLIYINKQKITVTTNKKAAKVYNDAETYDAKVFAEKQGVALAVEMVDVDD